MADETPAARRRRWLTIGEIVGVLALVISAASLWDSHQDRAETRAEAAARAKAPSKALLLTARAEDEGRSLAIASPDSGRIIQTQTVIFPSPLAVDKAETVGNPHIEAGWFADALHSAAHVENGRGRLPVVIVTDYIDDGTRRTDTALYDIGYRWRSRLLQADVPALEGLTLVARGVKSPQAAVDARWKRLHPGT
ncbi:MAG: hypothetical protein CFE37_11125 [Alphaproteobacteria bacterium PA4]|nr:MAG: hypothetical protein CFE37_11125 [Alphaproteobacteria bacterium PA4]